VKIQKTSLSRDQEIQLGKEAAAEVERTTEVLRNAEIEAWLNTIGQRLAKQPQANAYPYYFKLVNEDSINAFALPGGPMYVHTGLIKAADSEGQIAGVLAHEMSHVALRHGASQMSKAQTWQTVFGVIGAAAGIAGGGNCGLWCQAAQIGGGLGANTVLMKFSRDAERDADLNGARMIASAGYNPIEVARFFEKLEAQSGKASAPKGLATWMSSHPAPGRRVEYVSEDIAFYSKKDYSFNTGTFAQVKRLVDNVPPPKKKPAALMQPKPGAQPRTGLPQGFKDLQAEGFAIAYPSDWQAGQSQGGGSLYLVPKGGAKQSQNGGIELILGGVLDYSPQSGFDLQKSTQALIDTIRKSDPAVQVQSSQSTRVGNKPALVTQLRTKTSLAQEPDQVVYLYTVVRQEGLWNLALAAPPSQLDQFDPIFSEIVRTITFPD